MNDNSAVIIAVFSARQESVETINKSFRNAGVASHCLWAKDSHALIDQLNRDPQLVIIEQSHANLAARDIADIRSRVNPRLPVLFISTKIDQDILSDAFKLGANDVCSLNDSDRLVAVADRELRLYRAEHALDATLDSATQFKKHIKELMADTPDALAYIQEGIVVDINPAWIKMMGYSNEDELIAMPVMDCFKPESRGPLKGAIVATLKGKWNEDTLEITAIRKDGEEVKLKVSIQATEYDGEPCVKMNCAVQSDEPNTRELKLQNDALNKDPSTLLYHRSHFAKLASARLNKQLQSGVRVLAWIRPDDFARVSATTGFLESETAICEFADLVQGQILPNDICGRFDGLSVVVLLERGRLQDAENWAQRFVEQISRHVFSVGSHSLTFTCTVGLCGANEDAIELDDLLRGARVALDQGRKGGGNATVTNETSNTASRIQSYDAIWAKHLKSALVENRFRLLKQPVVGLDGSDKRMFDLLVRMLDPQGKPVLPSEFIPAAERNNMMQAIDRWVITAGLEFCKQETPAAAFVKLSYQSLQDTTLSGWLIKSSGAANNTQESLCFEVTEENAERYLRETKSLRPIIKDIGAKFALEHVGNAKQAARLIEHLEPDFVKIDGGLIARVAADEQVQDTVRSIVAYTNNIGAASIAERVEDANTMAVLWQLGIQYMQGHYVHEPEVVLEDTDGPRQAITLESSGR